MRRSLVAFFLAMVVLAAIGRPAAAEEPRVYLDTYQDGVRAGTETKVTSRGKGSSDNSAKSDKSAGSRKLMKNHQVVDSTSTAGDRDGVSDRVTKEFEEFKARVDRVQAEIDRKTATYNAAVDQYVDCMSGPRLRPCPPVASPDLPELPGQPEVRMVLIRSQGDPRTPPATGEAQPQIVLDPETVAYVALADLALKAPTPGIGPPPSLNKWDMAAVGYPLWLWAQGNTDPAPVSDSVYTLSVSLDARVAKIDFVMGDGNTVTCSGTDTKWTPAAKAGQESPTCGYRYSKPSLPKAKYTVTARTHWAIDWSINGQSGTIPYVQTASTQLPVGELQVLVR